MIREQDIPQDVAPQAEVHEGPGFDQITVISAESSPKLWEEAKVLEFETFRDAGYVTLRDELEEEYAPYGAASKFVIVERHGEMVGSTRIILPGENGFKTIADEKKEMLTFDDQGKGLITEYDLDSDGFEVGTLSVKDGYRTGPFDPKSVSISLYSGLIAYTGIFQEKLQRDRRGFVLASFDEKYLEKFDKAFGPSVQLLGPSQEYMGSKTTPVLIDVDKLLADDFAGLSGALLSLAEITANNE